MSTRHRVTITPKRRVVTRGRAVAASGQDGRITTTLEPLRGFYPAEAEHQDYLIRHPDSFYIVMNDAPKISALHRVYPELYRGEAVRVAAE